MYIHFRYYHGGNPYITINNKGLFYMIKKYNLRQEGKKAFFVIREWRKKHMTYTDKRELLREFAREWQANFCRFDYSMNDLINYQSFFEDYGKKYGLLREFRANGII